MGLVQEHALGADEGPHVRRPGQVSAVNHGRKKVLGGSKIQEAFDAAQRLVEYPLAAAAGCAAVAVDEADVDGWQPLHTPPHRSGSVCSGPCTQAQTSAHSGWQRCW